MLILSMFCETMERPLRITDAELAYAAYPKQQASRQRSFWFKIDQERQIEAGSDGWRRALDDCSCGDRFLSARIRRVAFGRQNRAPRIMSTTARKGLP